MASALSQALDRLTLANVWDLADSFGQGVRVPSRDGVVCSPFEPDRNPSFSISKGLRCWKDFKRGTPLSGVKGFVRRCRPDWSEEDVNRYLIERAGLRWVSKEEYAAEQAAKRGKDGAQRTAEQILREKKERRLQSQRAEKAARAKVLRDRRMDLAFPPVAGEPLRWPSCVKKAFEGGTVTMLQDAKRMRQLADKRGWPLHWVECLLESGRLSWSPLPWEGHGVGFLVEAPRFASKSVTRVPTGYHVRYVKPLEGGKVDKRWAYVPCHPKTWWTGSMADLLRAEAERLGLCDEDRWCPPAPFVLGNPDNAPRLVIFTEGQWDAITIWGALGGFEDCAPCDLLSQTVVLGIRGVEGVDACLSHWGRWLRQHQPAVWILADNDAAGRKWDTPDRPPGRPRAVSFVDRLHHAGLDRVVVSRIDPAYGKDFNDYYRAARPEIEPCWAWAESLGLIKQI